MLIGYLIDWGSLSVQHQNNFFKVPFFHPQKNTTAYSDLFFSSGLINIPVKKILSNPHLQLSHIEQIIASHNLHLVGGLFLCFLGQYLLGLHLFKKRIPALISASIFAFSWFHFRYIVHLQALLIAGIPFFFLFTLKYLKTKSNYYLLLAGLAFLYQALNSPLTAYFLLFIFVVLLIDKDVRKTIWEKKTQLLPILIGVLIIILFFYFPYLQVSQQFNYTRSIKDTAHSSLAINQLLSPEIFFYLMIIFISGKDKLVRNQKYQKVIMLITLLGFFLMLGPVVKVGDHSLKIFNIPLPLPYAIFYYLIPGFKAFRASSRWSTIFIFGLSLLIGFKLTNTNNGFLKKQTSQIFILLGLLVILWGSQVSNMEIYEIDKKIPVIYQTIKNRPEHNLAEFPTYVWSQTADYYKESYRLLYQSYHQKKLYNGYSGFIPQELEDRWHTISNTLDKEETIKHLKESEVQLVLLNLEDNPQYQEFSSAAYQLIECQENLCLYLLRN